MAPARLQLLEPESDPPVSPLGDLRRVLSTAVWLAIVLVTAAGFPGDVHREVRPTVARPSIAPPAPERIALELMPRGRMFGDCGEITAADPETTFPASRLLGIRRIDAGVRADQAWWWCIAGIRAYEDGLELIGVSRQERPDLDREPLLPAATFAAQLDCCYRFGESRIHRRATGWWVLHYEVAPGYRYAVDASLREAQGIYLRLAAIDGPWSFGTLAFVDGQLEASVTRYGVTLSLFEARRAYGALVVAYGPLEQQDERIERVRWQVEDAAGTQYRHARDGRLPESPLRYAFFEPMPPSTARSLQVAVQRLELRHHPDLEVWLAFR